MKACPDQQTLKRLFLGELPRGLRDELDEHLLSCKQCAAFADTISANDELIATVQSEHMLRGEEEMPAKAIERGQRIGCDVEVDETLLAERDPHRESADRSMLDENIGFLTPAEQPDEIGRLGGYRVLEVLGAGGMGVVFRAEDSKLERQIALKAMKPSVAASRSAKDRFLREAKATAAIEHDNIVTIHQVGQDRNVPFIAMQFLRGESLQKRLQRESSLPQHEVLRIGREIAAGLDAAHKQELIHRDIKPDNIWLEEKSGRVKIVDFGLVRTATDDAGLTQSGTVLGTPRYMAPEQAQGEAVDHRCDLFSLGSVLYHMATGKVPFEGSNLTATLIAVAQQDPVPVDKVRPELEPGLSQLIMRLLSKDREQRPQSAAQVGQAIAEIEQTRDTLEAEPGRQKKAAKKSILGKSPAAGSAQKTQPRSRLPIVAGGAVLTIALAIFAGLFYSGLIFKVETKDGTLTVRATGENFSTSAQGQQVTITNTETDETVTIDLDSPEVSKSLKPGSYFILTTNDGLRAETTHFTIRSGTNEVVEVTWKPRPRIDGSRSPDVEASSGPVQQKLAPGVSSALSFDGRDDHVEIPTLSLSAGPFSIEALVEFSSVPPNSKLTTIVSDEGGGFFLSANSKHGVSFLLSRDGRLAGNELPSSFEVGQRVHVRAVFDGSELILAANGKQTAHPFAEFRGSKGHVVLGMNPNVRTWFHGVLYGLRISKAARYRQKVDTNAGFENDEHTLALYHFNEGQGETLVDSSGNDHHGTIHGASWMKADGATSVLQAGVNAEASSNKAQDEPKE